MNSEITFMDCWHYTAPLLPINNDYAREMYCMVFRALKEADEREAAEKRKKKKEEKKRGKT